MLTPDLPPNIFGGIGIHVHELSKQLCNFGHNVDIIHIKYNKFTTEEYTENNKNKYTTYSFIEGNNQIYKQNNISYCTPKLIVNNANTLIPVLEIVNKNHFDIIHIHDYYFALFADIFIKKYNIKVVTTIHSAKTQQDFLEDHFRKYLCVVSDGLICVSKFLSDEINSKYSLNRPITIIHNGISLSHQKKKKEKTISFSARIVENKGCTTLIKAFSLLIADSKYSNWNLHIVGNGESFDICSKLAKELRIDNKIIFHGYQSNEIAREIINYSTIHITPSLYETFGISALEGLAEGTCVIASNTGGFKEFIKDEYNGLLFEPGNEYDLSKKMKKLIDNLSLRNILIKNGYETVNRFNWDVVAQQTLNLYKNIINI